MANIREAYNYIIISLSVQTCVLSRCTFWHTHVRTHASMTHAGVCTHVFVSRWYYLKITSDERRQRVVRTPRGSH